MIEAAIKLSITSTSGMLVVRNERGQYYHSATNKYTLRLDKQAFSQRHHSKLKYIWAKGEAERIKKKKNYSLILSSKYSILLQLYSSKKVRRKRECNEKK